MAALEEEGYIAQPHTSAGRIPTDKGYRLFVDRLSTVKPLSTAERRAIQTFLDGALDLDDVVTRTVRLLAQLTRQVAVVQYPSLTRSSVRHVELVPLTTVAADARADHQHRPGRAARGRDRRSRSPTSCSASCAPAQRRAVGRGSPTSPAGSADLPDRFTAEDRPAVQRRAVGAARDPGRASTRNGSCSAAPPTSPASGPTSR